MKMIMIEGNDDDTFTLYCYEDDDVVWENTFNDESTAKSYGARYLDGEFKQGFEMHHG